MKDDIKVRFTMSQLNMLIAMVSGTILATPTSSTRNELSTINIALVAAQQKLDDENKDDD